VIEKPELADDPILIGPERAMLIGFLDYFRRVLVRKASGLNQAQLATTLTPSTLTIAGLVKHLAHVEDFWFTYCLLGAPMRGSWASSSWDDDRDCEMTSATHDSPEQLLTQFETSVARSDSALTLVTDLDQLAAVPPRRGATSLRWILIHMVEEYARHLGHVDLIRESIDGSVDD